MVRQETAFIKAEGRYANTGRSQGTATRGLMQGPRALGWVGGEPSAAGESTGPSVVRGGGDPWAAQGRALHHSEQSLEYF